MEVGYWGYHDSEAPKIDKEKNCKNDLVCGLLEHCAKEVSVLILHAATTWNFDEQALNDSKNESIKA